MNHSFNVDIAAQYGVNEAILLENINFWISKNKANNKHFYEGTTWTYNSAKAFTELFPYWTERQVINIITKLENNGLIKKGNYNAMKYDRTCWYALTELSETIYQNCNLHIPKKSNGNTQNVRPIPVINTDINTKKEIYKEKPPSLKLKIKEKMETECKEWLEYYNKRCGSVYRSCKPILNNFSYWRDVYKMDELKIVIHLAQDDDWFKNKMTPMLLLRTRNKNGDCDYIGELLEKYKGHYEL